MYGRKGQEERACTPSRAEQERHNSVCTHRQGKSTAALYFANFSRNILWLAKTPSAEKIRLDLPLTSRTTSLLFNHVHHPHKRCFFYTRLLNNDYPVHVPPPRSTKRTLRKTTLSPSPLLPTFPPSRCWGLIIGLIAQNLKREHSILRQKSRTHFLWKEENEFSKNLALVCKGNEQRL